MTPGSAFKSMWVRIPSPIRLQGLLNLRILQALDLIVGTPSNIATLPRKVPFWLAIHRWYSVWLNEPREDSQGKKTPVFPSCAWWYWRWGIATCEATTKSRETSEHQRAKLNFPWNRNATGLEAFEEWCFWYQEESVHRKSLLALGVQKMVALTQEVEFLWMFVVFRWSNIKKGTILDFL